MKRFLFVFSVFAAIACLTFMTVACGASNPCEAAFNKQKSCWSSKDCSNLPTASAKSGCETAKKSTYQDVVRACELLVTGFGGSDTSSCQCQGNTKAKAEVILNCTLDETTCGCK